jgi:SAM-dependent methyltransferase
MTKPDVIFAPICPEAMDRAIELARISERDTVYEMGCGDARLLIAAAKRHGCKGVGFEVRPELIEEANKRAQAAGVSHLVTIKEQDMFTVDLRPADVVFLYILPHLNLRMIPQLLDMRRGSRIVSSDFDIVRHIPDVVVQDYLVERNIYKTTFLYYAPLRHQVQPVKKEWVESRICYDSNDLSLLPMEMR